MFGLKALTYEKLSVYLHALVFTGVWSFARVGFPDPYDNLLASSITVSSVMVGFLTTVKVILITIQSTRVIQRLAKSGYLDIFYTYLKEGIVFSFIFCLVCIGGFFLKPEHVMVKILNFSITQEFAYSWIWVFLGSLAVASYLRVYRILFSLLKHVKPEDPQS